MNHKDILCIITEFVYRMMDDGNVIKCYVVGYVFKVCEIFMETEFQTLIKRLLKFILFSHQEKDISYYY